MLYGSESENDTEYLQNGIDIKEVCMMNHETKSNAEFDLEKYIQSS